MINQSSLNLNGGKKAMAHTITFKYTAVVAPVVNPVAPICPVMMPTNAAADMKAFEGTYYDTNVAGWGEGTALEAFMAQVDAHPGLVAAVKQAIKKGECTFTEATDKDVLYLNEVAGSLADQGIEIIIDATDEDAAAAVDSKTE